jgi:hypothetical protein
VIRVVYQKLFLASYDRADAATVDYIIRTTNPDLFEKHRTQFLHNTISFQLDQISDHEEHSLLHCSLGAAIARPNVSLEIPWLVQI